MHLSGLYLTSMFAGEFKPDDEVIDCDDLYEELERLKNEKR